MSKKRKKKDNVTYTKKANSSEYVSSENVNAWRNEPGVNEPLRIGRALRTRDEFFMGQKGKIIHPEQHPDELYRRGAVAGIGKKNKLAVVITKRAKSSKGNPIPNDQQNRKYLPEINTLDEKGEPIRLKQGKFELAPTHEDVTSEQMEAIVDEISKDKVHSKRLNDFYKATKNKHKKSKDDKPC